MRPNRRSLHLGALGGLLFLAAGCGRKPDVVRVAVAAPLTGDMGSEGRGLARAVDLALEEANSTGRFPYKLELAPYDDRADPEEAVKVAGQIAADTSIAAVIGHRTSGCAVVAAKVYAKASLPMISPSATNPEVTLEQLEPGWSGPRIVFRIVPTDDAQGAFAAKYVYQTLKKRRVAVVDDKTIYGRGLSAQFSKTFKELGGTVAGTDGVAVGAKDFSVASARIKAAKPDAVFFGGLYPEAGGLLKRLRADGVAEPFVSGDGAKTPSLFKAAGAAADGAYLTFAGEPIEDIPGAASFLSAYKRRWNGADEEVKAKDHLAYEAARIALAALEKAGPSDKGRLLEALRATHYEGLLGLTTFDEKGDTNNKTITITRARFKDKAFEVLASSKEKP